MNNDAIIIKGNRDGINVIVDSNKFNDFDEMVDGLRNKLSNGRKFYKGAVIKITISFKFISQKEMSRLKDILFDEFLIRDCIFKDTYCEQKKIFTGIYEGRTKFLRKTVRSGQSIEYSGNIVVIGDVNHGAEIRAAGNIVILGKLMGRALAGSNGNDKAIIAALYFEPEIIQIDTVISRSPEDDDKPTYPEVAKLKGKSIIVEPYVSNKYL